MLIDKTTSSIFASTTFITILLREAILIHESIDESFWVHNYLKQRFGKWKCAFSFNTNYKGFNRLATVLLDYVYFYPVHWLFPSDANDFLCLISNQSNITNHRSFTEYKFGSEFECSTIEKVRSVTSKLWVCFSALWKFQE